MTTETCTAAQTGADLGNGMSMGKTPTANCSCRCYACSRCFNRESKIRWEGKKTPQGWVNSLRPGILTEETPYRKKSRNITKALLWGKREEAVAITAIRMDMTKIRLM